MAGLTVNAANIHLQVGTVARNQDAALDDIVEIAEFLDQHTAGDLETKFGLTAADANLIKSAFNATMTGAVTTFRANASMAFMKQLMGMGSV